MDNLPVKNPFDDITAEEVYEEARSQGVIERIFDDFKSCVKNSSSYISLMEAAKQTILCEEFLTKPKSDNIQNTKKRIHEIGLLSSQFEASVSDFFAATIEVEGKPAIEKIIKQLAFSKKESATNAISSSKTSLTPNNVGRYDESKPGTSKSVCEADEESESVSSVHTSELSSLSDEVGARTEDPDSKNKKTKILSFQSVNKAYKSMIVEEKKKSPVKRKRVKSTSKAPVSSGLKSSSETVLPKRKRKPNSRYVLK